MGKSMSEDYPHGQRKIEKSTNLELSPRSLRKKWKYLKDCPEDELKKIFGSG